VIASQYRGNDGGEGKEEYGGADVNDVLNLILSLNFVSVADTSRIGMYGWSRGGMMTYMALAKTTRIKAAVVKAGLADVVKIWQTRPEADTGIYQRLIPGYSNDKRTALEKRSAVYFAAQINKTTPLLIFQGTADAFVPADQAIDLVSKLYVLKQPLRFILYEGGTHSLREYRSE
jgi:dipeptidyl aminopeptidase/acylaminoacyl peptidase